MPAISSLSKLQSSARPTLSISYFPRDRLKLDPKNARLHSAKQIRQIAGSIETFGFNFPILVDGDLNVIAGHGRLLACKRLGWAEVPTAQLGHLSETQKRAFMIADNLLTEIASWDDRLLAEQLQILASVELDFDIETIGFDMGEIDLRVESLNAKETSAAEAPIPVSRDHPSVGSAICGSSGGTGFFAATRASGRRTPSWWEPSVRRRSFPIHCTMSRSTAMSLASASSASGSSRWRLGE